MQKVAILFDNYSPVGQPFLADWYHTIKPSQQLLIRGFTDKFDDVPSNDITPLKTDLSFFAKIKYKILGSSNQLLQFKPNIIHLINAQHFHLHENIINQTKAKLTVSFRGYETFVKPHEDDQWKYQLDIIFKRAQSLHFVSNAIKDEAIKLGAPKEKCTVIYRTVDTDFFKPLKNKTDTKKLILTSIGRPIWQKGFPHLINALSKLKADTSVDFMLNIVGEGNLLDDLKQLSIDKGLDNHINFIPYLNRQDLQHLLSETDIYIHPALSDALPNSILEASSMQIPIISTFAGGIPEAVVNNKTGLLCEPGNETELYKALHLLTVNKTLASSLAIEARKNMLTHFNKKNEMDTWNNYYSNL